MLLGAITIIEVVFALFAKGHIVPSVTFGKDPGIGHGLYMLAMIGASIYKAYFIIFFFMHMASEVRGMMFSVLMPMLLLVWAVIAFFNEGSSWGARREKIKDRNEQVLPSNIQKHSYILPTQSGGNFNG
jgi:cytochrome c oxidase subunit IV